VSKNHIVSQNIRVLFENDNQKDSLEIILKHIDSITEKEPKTALYRALAHYYKKWRQII
jgi:hypothetical protein